MHIRKYLSSVCFDGKNNLAEADLVEDLPPNAETLGDAPAELEEVKTGMTHAATMDPAPRCWNAGILYIACWNTVWWNTRMWRDYIAMATTVGSRSRRTYSAKLW